MNDESIIEQVLCGDTEAFSALVARHQGSVRSVISRGLFDEATTSDLTQQTFINAYLKLQTFKRGSDFGVWVRSIGRNLLRNELRRRSREAAKMARYHDWLLSRLEQITQAEQQEQHLRETLNRCRSSLSPTASRALELRYEQGLSFEAIAEHLGRTVDASRQLLTRVRQALRECVKKEEASA